MDHNQPLYSGGRRLWMTDISRDEMQQIDVRLLFFLVVDRCSVRRYDKFMCLVIRFSPKL
jgi:hypothetical protein